MSPEPPRRDGKLVALLAEAHEAQALVLAQPERPVASIAAKACRKRMGQLLAISCLAPDILTAVLEARQPATLSAKTLLQIELPMDWAEQRALLAGPSQ